MEERCSICRFYYEHLRIDTTSFVDKNDVEQLMSTEQKYYSCRRYPKHVGRNPDEWCGEFKHRKKKENQ